MLLHCYSSTLRCQRAALEMLQHPEATKALDYTRMSVLVEGLGMESPRSESLTCQVKYQSATCYLLP